MLGGNKKRAVIGEMMPYLFKDEMISMYQSAQTIHRGLEVLVEDYLNCDMDLVATSAAALRDQTRWMDSVLLIILHGCNHLGRNFWKRPNPRLIYKIGCCLALLYSIQDRLDKICQRSSEKRAAQLNILNLTTDWHRFWIALEKADTGLKVQFPRRKRSQMNGF
jgi:hypothetical protein